MKKYLPLLITAVLLLCLGTVSADETMENPSVYSAADIAQHMSSYWLANYHEIEEFLKQYPDLQCDTYPGEDHYDQIVCLSVNNLRAEDIIINFFFWGDHAGMTGLEQVSYTLGCHSPEKIQEYLEHFWLEGAVPSHRSGNDSYYDTLITLTFNTLDTQLIYDIPRVVDEGLDFINVTLRDTSTYYDGTE